MAHYNMFFLLNEIIYVTTQAESAAFQPRMAVMVEPICTFLKCSTNGDIYQLLFPVGAC